MLLVLFVALGAGLCGTTLAAGGQDTSPAGQSVQELNREGSKLFASERPAEAAEYFRHSLQLNPGQPVVAKLLGLSLQLSGDFDEAIRTFQLAGKLDNRDSEPWFYLGRLYYGRNFFDLALEALRKALRLDPHDSRSHYFLALTLEAEGGLEASESSYRQAIRWNRKRNKPDYSPHYSYGVLLGKLGRFDESEKQFEKAIAIEPSAWRPHFELGKLLHRAGKLKEAKEQLRAALETGAASPGEQSQIHYALDRVAVEIHREESVRKPAAEPQPVAPIRFIESARESGIDFVLNNAATQNKHQVETMPAGIAAFDFDNDGFEDLYFVNGATSPGLEKTGPAFWNRLYRNNGDRTFSDVTGQAGVAGEGYGMAAAVGDYDNDGWKDLFVAGVNRNILYRNQGDGTFGNVTSEAGLANDKPPKPWSISAGWFDYDNDGDLDLFVVNYCKWNPKTEPFCGQRRPGYRTYCHPKSYEGLPNSLFRNNGDGTFEDVSAAAGIEDHVGKGMGVAFADYDGDGWQDVFVANDTVQNFLFHNRGNGSFEEVGLRAGVALTENGTTISSMGADFRDIDNDGLPDLFITALSNETFPLFLNRGGGMFQDMTYPSQLGFLSLPSGGFGNGVFDLNNDGWKDIFVAGSHVMDNEELYSSRHSKQRNRVFVNTGGATFADAGSEDWPRRFNRGAAFADFDNDGRVDVAVSCLNDPAELLWNDSTKAHNWIQLVLQGRTSNRDGIGAIVRIVDDTGRVQYNHATTSVGYACSSSGRIQFGIGRARRIERIEIRWPSGQVQVLRDVQAGRLHKITEQRDSDRTTIN